MTCVFHWSFSFQWTVHLIGRFAIEWWSVTCGYPAMINGTDTRVILRTVWINWALFHCFTAQPKVEIFFWIFPLWCLEGRPLSSSSKSRSFRTSCASIHTLKLFHNMLNYFSSPLIDRLRFWQAFTLLSDSSHSTLCFSFAKHQSRRVFCDNLHTIVCALFEVHGEFRVFR
jgi:hypothetical protein